MHLTTIERVGHKPGYKLKFPEGTPPATHRAIASVAKGYAALLSYGKPVTIEEFSKLITGTFADSPLRQGVLDILKTAP